jgi:hypothetical protein
MWQAHMPLKVKKIVCLVLRNRIQTVDNLDRKNWQGDKKCQLCGEEENVDRLIFRCPIAVFMWTVMREGLEWPLLCARFRGKLPVKAGAGENECNMDSVWGYNLNFVA